MFLLHVIKNIHIPDPKREIFKNDLFKFVQVYQLLHNFETKQNNVTRIKYVFSRYTGSCCNLSNALVRLLQLTLCECKKHMFRLQRLSIVNLQPFRAPVNLPSLCLSVRPSVCTHATPTYQTLQVVCYLLLIVT